MLFSGLHSRIFMLSSPHPPVFPCICCNSLRYACSGVCRSREGCMCNKVLIEAFDGKLLNYVLFSLGLLCFLHPTPLCFHAFVATLFVMLAVGFVGQGKVACTIRVWLKHLRESYSTATLKSPRLKNPRPTIIWSFFVLHAFFKLLFFK